MHRCESCHPSDASIAQEQDGDEQLPVAIDARRAQEVSRLLQEGPSSLLQGTTMDQATAALEAREQAALSQVAELKSKLEQMEQMQQERQLGSGIPGAAAGGGAMRSRSSEITANVRALLAGSTPVRSPAAATIAEHPEYGSLLDHSDVATTPQSAEDLQARYLSKAKMHAEMASTAPKYSPGGSIIDLLDATEGEQPGNEMRMRQQRIRATLNEGAISPAEAEKMLLHQRLEAALTPAKDSSDQPEPQPPDDPFADDPFADDPFQREPDPFADARLTVESGDPFASEVPPPATGLLANMQASLAEHSPVPASSATPGSLLDQMKAVRQRPTVDSGDPFAADPFADGPHSNPFSSDESEDDDGDPFAADNPFESPPAPEPDFLSPVVEESSMSSPLESGLSESGSESESSDEVEPDV